MKFSEIRFADELFTHIGEDGVEIHINASAMLRDIRDALVHPIFTKLELFEDIVRDLRQNHGVEEAHLKAIRQDLTRLAQPILLIEFEDMTTLVVDGNHRVVALWDMGVRNVHAYVFPYTMWQKYRLNGLTEHERKFLLSHLEL